MYSFRHDGPGSLTEKVTFGQRPLAAKGTSCAEITRREGVLGRESLAGVGEKLVRG